MNNAKYQFLNLGCIQNNKHHPPLFNTLQPHQCSWASYAPAYCDLPPVVASAYDQVYDILGLAVEELLWFWWADWEFILKDCAL